MKSHIPFMKMDYLFCYNDIFQIVKNSNKNNYHDEHHLHLFCLLILQRQSNACRHRRLTLCYGQRSNVETDCACIFLGGPKIILYYCPPLCNST